MNVEPKVFSEGVPRRVARNTVISIIGKIATVVAILALNIAIARVLGDAAYGQYASVYALVAIGGVIANMGIESIVVRESAKNLSRAPELISNSITLRLVLGTFAYAIAVAAAMLMKPDTAFVRYVAIGGLVLFASWYVLMATYFKATLRIGTHTLITVGSVYVSLAVTLVVLFLKGGLDGILWGSVLATCIMLIVVYALVSSHFRPKLGRNFTVMKQVLSASWPLAAMMFMIMLVGRIDQLMLLKMKGASIAGHYGASTRIAESLAIIPQSFMLSMFPLMSFYHSGQPARFANVYGKSLKYMSTIVLPLALFLSFYSRPVLDLCYGEEFVRGAPALAILAWRTFFLFVGSVNSAAIVVENRQRIFMTVGVAMVPPFIAVTFLLIWRYGLIGAAAATVVHQVMSYLVMLVVPSMRKYVIAAVSASWRPILAIGCAAVVVYWMQSLTGSVLALAVYALALAALRVFDREDWDLLLKVIWKL